MINRIHTFSILFCFFMFFSVSILAAENSWHLKQDEDNIEVYVAKTEDSAVKSFRGVMIVDSSLNTVLSIISDASSYPQWLHNCKSATTIKSEGENENFNHIVTDMPWPVVDRDSIVHSVKTQDASTNQVIINFTSKSNMLKKLPNTVRITKMHGLWELTPLNNGKLNILYQVSVDPGGSIPKWLVNSMLVDMPFYTLKNLRKIIKEST